MDEHESTPAVTRRQALKAGIGAAATLGVAGAGTASAQSDAYGGHLAGDRVEWDGTTADASGMDEVVVDVGAGQQGLQFDPPALYVEPGTTILWTWTGEGGGHNVVDDEGVIDSREQHEGDTTREEGFTYEFTVEEDHDGVHPYVCVPHETVGMKGVVVVGEDNVETDLVSLGDGGDEGLGMGAIAAGAGVFSVISLLGVAAYSELVGKASSEETR